MHAIIHMRTLVCYAYVWAVSLHLFSPRLKFLIFIPIRFSNLSTLNRQTSDDYEVTKCDAISGGNQ